MRGQAVAADGTVIDDSDTDALWLYDAYEDKFVEKIYQNDRYDVGYIAISSKTEEPAFISYYGDKPEKIWLDKDLEQVYASIEASFPNDQVSIGGWTEDEDKGFMNVGKSINLGGIVAHLTKAVQELSKKVDSQQKEIEELKS